MLKNMKRKIIFALLISIFAINTLFGLVVSASTKDVTPMKPWRYSEKLENVKVKYRDNQIVITGKAKGISRVAAKYNKKVKTAEVKSGKFQLKLKYTMAKDIKLYGLNSHSQKITKDKTIRSEEFVTAAPLCRNISRTQKGISYEIDTEAGSLLTVKYKGKTIKKIYVDSSFEKVFIPAKDLKGKKGKLTFTQKNTNKRVSRKGSYSIIKVGEKQTVNY